MKRVLFALALLCLFTLGQRIEPTLAQSNGAPQITSFTTTARSVSRDALSRRTARIPLAWTTANRPIIANLFFEQVLPDGSVINVELPRLIPWVNSNEKGMAAPILPGDSATEIVLRVRLVNLLTNAVLSERQLTLPIVANGDGGSPGGGRPSLRTFVTPTVSVRADQLDNRSARVPVSWEAINRPPTSNLIFEQVLADGRVVNVELPRENPWVNSKGDGVAAPYAPGESATQIHLRVRLIDLLTGRVYDQRSLSLPITRETQPGRIRLFATTATGVNEGSLASRSARIPVSWAVDNRPDNSNLVFEQVLDDNSVVNVELPRPIPWVASQGDGVVAPLLPKKPETATIQLQIRLVNLGDGATIDRKEIVLPIAERSQSPYEQRVDAAQCFSGAFPASNGIEVGKAGRATVAVSASGLPLGVTPRGIDSAGTLLAGETFTVVDGPYCYRFTYTSTSTQLHYRLWKIRRDRDGVEGWVSAFSIAVPGGAVTHFVEGVNAAPQPQIVSFTADKNTAAPGDLITLNWTVANTTGLKIRALLTDNPAEAVIVDSGLALPGGSAQITVPASIKGNTVGTIFLEAYGEPNQPPASLSLNISLVCAPGSAPDAGNICQPIPQVTEPPTPDPIVTEPPVPPDPAVTEPAPADSAPQAALPAAGVN